MNPSPIFSGKTQIKEFKAFPSSKNSLMWGFDR